MNILRFLGLSRCHYCNRIVWPWQEFYGQISTTLIPDGKPHHLYAKYVTHAGRCTEEDIKRMNEEKKKKSSS